MIPDHRGYQRCRLGSNRSGMNTPYSWTACLSKGESYWLGLTLTPVVFSSFWKPVMPKKHWPCLAVTHGRRQVFWFQPRLSNGPSFSTPDSAGELRIGSHRPRIRVGRPLAWQLKACPRAWLRSPLNSMSISGRGISSLSKASPFQKTSFSFTKLNSLSRLI